MISPERWRRVQEIFLAVADLPAAERTSALEAACSGDADLKGEVESLLDSDARSQETLNTAIEEAAARLLESDAAVPGAYVGPYRLVREIGRGGMGVVFLAVREDDPNKAEVAVKLIRPGLDTDFILRRFRKERQILARLRHSNIARLLDAGLTKGNIPYLVLEYVQGSWITRYALQRRLGIEARLKLFQPVCAAVAYVHAAFIIHRDLKPGNILVDGAGVPKLLDFGISKLLRSGPVDPGESQSVGFATPDYASPEQMLGEPVTVATDVYSLGAVLYEMLTGLKPHRLEHVPPLQMERVICEEPVAPPSEVVRDLARARRLRGDLDRIVGCAMDKDPARRYPTVDLLLVDLQRHARHEPLVAKRRPALIVDQSAMLLIGAAGLAAAGLGMGFLGRRGRNGDGRGDRLRNRSIRTNADWPLR